MSVDPDVAAILLALGSAGLVGLLASGRGAVQRRRAQRFCLNCGRRLIRSHPTCDCSP